ncbi:MAG TPA: endonuclease/exonuclease/phosphatase family protein [Pyrinomonadaceae bacterium]|nr:endonuclease/exonuclease/phosphatase family protein [Pyrinomonadaceae bacterium]
MRNAKIYTAEAAPHALNHELRPYFPSLAQFDSTKALEASSVYRMLRPEIERLLGSVVREDLAATHAEASPRTLPVRVTAWNIERGLRLAGITRALREHPIISASDVLLLTELDYGMARTGNRFIARELAESLGMNYVFAPCYLALNKGSGLESRAEGENEQALHGNALLSRHPLHRAHAVALPNGKDKMRGKEKRLGSQRAVVADVSHPAGEFRAVSIHLDAHSTQRHRQRQMSIVLDHLDSLRPQLPVVIGGDWNTTTYNSRRAVYAIGGFFRRVLMGVNNVIKNHYPHPDRWFERGLFRELERRGYNYRALNEPGAGTLHYDVQDLAANSNMGEWVPQWCFWWINWALSKSGGRCSLKLDWFTAKGIEPHGDAPPKVIGGLRDEAGALSDHDPIVLDFLL